MITTLLDTSIYSEILKPRPHPGVIACWDGMGDTELAISAITEAEVLAGLEKRSSIKMWTLYQESLENRLPILSVEKNIAARYAKEKASLESRGQLIECLDILIGATALVHGLTLITANVKHFERIPGLHIEDWTRQ